MMTAERARGSSGKGKKKVRVGIGQKEEYRIRGRLRGNTGDPSRPDPDGVMLPTENPHNGTPFSYFPSESWVDATFLQIDDVDADGKDISVRFHNPHFKLPTALVRCPACARRTPANAMEGGRCMDCHDVRQHEIHGESPSAVAIAAIRHRKLRMEQAKLPKCSRSAISREIRIFKKTGRVPQ